MAVGSTLNAVLVHSASSFTDKMQGTIVTAKTVVLLANSVGLHDKESTKGGLT